MDIDNIDKYINNLIRHSKISSLYNVETICKDNKTSINIITTGCSLSIDIISSNYIFCINRILYVDDMNSFLKNLFLKFNSDGFKDIYQIYKYLHKNYKFKLNKIKNLDRNIRLIARFLIIYNNRYYLSEKYGLDKPEYSKKNNNTILLEMLIFDIIRIKNDSGYVIIAFKNINGINYIDIRGSSYNDTLELNYENIRMLFSYYKKSRYPTKWR